MKTKGVDKIFLWIVIALVVVGLIMFVSSSLGILARNETKFYGVIFNQLLYGFVGGFVALYVGLKIPYKFWREYSLIIFIISVILTVLVFVPGVGMEHGGARRWIEVLGVSLQPVEFLKIGFVIYFASWLSWAKKRVQDFKYSILPLGILLIFISLILLRQPDTKSLILITVTSLGMLFVSGTPWKYILGLLALSLVGFILLVSFKPYLMERVKTFIDPSQNGSSSSYQLQQSLIAIGSGGLFGRGIGQSVQKFNYLPEPQGDSIFAVVGEETGFVGSIVIIILYIAFTFRGYKIAINAPDAFSKLFVVGTITIIIAQSFMNMASITGVFPLTGVPLVFMSHGGTALLLSLGLIGVILNISKNEKNTRKLIKNEIE
jgi:cell division protein FtsW